MIDHNMFLQGIHEKRIIDLIFYSEEDRRFLSRKCAPMDYGTTTIAKDNIQRYHFFDFTSDSGPHTLLLHHQRIDWSRSSLSNEKFDPKEIIRTFKKPYTWKIPREGW